MRAGRVVVGSSGVQARLRRGEVELVIIAADQSRRTAEKVGRLAAARGVPVLTGPSAAELGRRVGRNTVQAVGVCDPHLARGMMTGQALYQEDVGGKQDTGA